MSDNSAWLASLKAGDEVAIDSSYGRRWRMAKVNRVTATQVIVGQYNAKYRRADGRSVGTQIWESTYIHEPTPEIRENVEIDRLTEKAKNLRSSIAIPATKGELVAFICALTPFVKKEG